MEKTGSKPTDVLVARAVRGDGLAFTALWDTYIDDLRAYIRKTVTTLDGLYVDDVCSRSFEKAFRQISSFDPAKSQFFTWLRVIARNTALDLVDQEKRYHPQNMMVYLDEGSAAGAMADSLPDELDTPLDSIIREETHRKEEACVEHLPELYREIARLRLVNGLQYKEISEVTGIELNTVRTRIRRAKALIKKMKEDEEQL